MADAFYGEIRAFAFTYPPEDWAQCAGQTIAVQQNQALYSVVGNTFGGTSPLSFKLPNLQALVVVGAGTGPQGLNFQFATTHGSEAVSIATNSLIAQHTHTWQAKTLITQPVVSNMSQTPSADVILSRPVTQASASKAPPSPMFDQGDTPDIKLPATTIGPAGGNGAAHENRQPYLPLLFCICLNGIYPTPPD
jgi:microcystin-dependent protein